MGIAVIWLLVVIGANVHLEVMLAPLFLFGLSIGLTAAQLNTVIMSDVPHPRAGDARRPNRQLAAWAAPLAPPLWAS